MRSSGQLSWHSMGTSTVRILKVHRTASNFQALAQDACIMILAVVILAVVRIGLVGI